MIFIKSLKGEASSLTEDPGYILGRAAFGKERPRQGKFRKTPIANLGG